MRIQPPPLPPEVQAVIDSLPTAMAVWGVLVLVAFALGAYETCKMVARESRRRYELEYLEDLGWGKGVKHRKDERN